MKKILFLLTLLTASSAFADVIIHNDSDESILVNVHIKGFSHGGGHKMQISADSIQRYHGLYKGDEIDYISFHILTGPFNDIGGRLDIKKQDV